MRFARVVAVASLLFSPLVAQAADSAAALKKLEAARAALTDAVKKAEKDPPATADLDAAHAAVEALKVAIDAGAEFEANDLDYAKAALAARKELRTQRDYVDQRRANIKVHEARRNIDGALGTLAELMKRADAKDAGAKDFEAARTSVGVVKKLLDENRPFGKQDPKFATFVTETEALLAKDLKAIDDRGLKIMVEKNRADLNDAQKTLASAIGALGKDATDAQFKAADAAATAVAKQLEGGKDFEAKDSGYKGDAEKARKDLAAAKKRMEDYLAETGLNRLKVDIEPAANDLAAALKVLRGKPTDEQIAEAKTAAIVVRKLVEKFQPEAARSPAFGKYIEEVKKTLADVDGEMARRSLSTVKTDVQHALSAIAKRDVTDEQLGELNTAITVLEKTIEASPKKDATMTQPLEAARNLVKDARAALAKRKQEVEISRQKAKVEDAKKVANEAMKAIAGPKLEPEAMTAAENAVKLIATVLDAGKDLKKKDGDYVKYDNDTRKRITELNDRIAQRKKAAAAADLKAALQTAVADATAKIETAKAPAGTDADLDAATKAFEAVGKMLDDQVKLEATDQAYAATADRARSATYKLLDNLQLAQAARELRRATGESLAAGDAAAKTGEGTSDLKAKKKANENAASQYRACERDGGAVLRRIPVIEKKVMVLADGQPIPPRDVIALCVKRAEAAEAAIKEVVPLIAFDDGPRKAYEAAKGFMSKGKKSEALAQYNECVTTGVILRNRSPDLKEKKLTVAGTSLTIEELIAQCQTDRKALSGK